MNTAKTKDTAMLRAKPLFSTWQIVAIMMLFALTMGTVLFGGEVVPVLADGIIQTGKVDTIMEAFITLVSKIALYVGIALVLWGLVNAILAYRREDSEGIINNVKLLIIGAILAAIGPGLSALYNQLKS